VLVRSVLFASSNRNKYEEVVALLAPLQINLVFGPERLSLDVDETYQTYMGNAYLKAAAWAEASGMPSLADDSGLEVRALQWKPGIFSARVAASSEARNKWLLQSLEGKEDRTAKYVAAFALCFPEEGHTIITEGECWGKIAEEQQGEGGFGYDPLFIPQGFDSPFADLPDKIKARISHRAIASYQLIHILQQQM
jgi:XTP/dITP diphosphohydrolase